MSSSERSPVFRPTTHITPTIASPTNTVATRANELFPSRLNTASSDWLRNFSGVEQLVVQAAARPLAFICECGPGNNPFPTLPVREVPFETEYDAWENQSADDDARKRGQQEFPFPPPDEIPKQDQRERFEQDCAGETGTTPHVVTFPVPIEGCHHQPHQQHRSLSTGESRHEPYQ